MPTLLNNGPCLCLELLENRCLLSADVVLAEPVVITGTDAHDVVTLTRLHNGLLEVAIQSFHDPEWTVPTDEPILRYESPLGYGELAFGLWFLSDPAQRVMMATSASILVDAGAGNDRIEVIDLLGEPYLVSGTHRTDDAWSKVTGDALLVPWYDEQANGIWVYAHDVWTTVIRDFYAGTLIEGVDMAEGATVGVRFEAAPSRHWLVTDPPIWIEPLPDPTGGTVDVPADEPISEVLLDAAGLDIFIGEQVEAEPSNAFDPWLVEGAGPDWTDEAGLSNLWVEWTDDLPIDQWNSESDYFDDGSNGMMSDEMYDWLDE